MEEPPSCETSEPEPSLWLFQKKFTEQSINNFIYHCGKWDTPCLIVN